MYIHFTKKKAKKEELTENDVDKYFFYTFFSSFKIDFLLYLKV